MLEVFDRINPVETKDLNVLGNSHSQTIQGNGNSLGNAIGKGHDVIEGVPSNRGKQFFGERFSKLKGIVVQIAALRVRVSFNLVQT